MVKVFQNAEVGCDNGEGEGAQQGIDATKISKRLQEGGPAVHLNHARWGSARVGGWAEHRGTRWDITVYGVHGDGHGVTNGGR